MRIRSRSIAFLAVAALALSLGGCKPDDPVAPAPTPVAPSPTGTLKLTVVPEWEDAPLQLFTEYHNFMDYRVSVELLKMYFGDVRFIGEPGDTAAVKDVDLFVLDAPVSKYWPAPVGAWTKIRAALGVPSELNYANPANYGPGHPLSVSNGTYWIWATGYRYLMFEGRYDTDPNGTAPLISAYSLHPGTDAVYTEFELAPPMPIEIVQGDTTEVIVHLAVDRFFHSPEYQIDLSLDTENSAHNTNLPVQLKLVHNVIASMSVE